MLTLPSLHEFLNSPALYVGAAYVLFRRMLRDLKGVADKARSLEREQARQKIRMTYALMRIAPAEKHLEIFELTLLEK
jgi:hypothetical protein